MTQFFSTRALVRDLRDHDTRQLLDIGLIRAADGSLRLADDPSVDAFSVNAERPIIGHPLAALSETLRRLIRPADVAPGSASERVIRKEIAA